MLPKLSENLEKILDEFKYSFTKEQIKDIYKLLEYYDDGILPLGAMRRKLRIEMTIAKDLAVYLETKGILKSMYKVICRDNSNDVIEKEYEDIRSIPNKTCDKCSEECLLYENIVVVFKVV